LPLSSSRFDALVDVVDRADRVVGTLVRKQLLASGANFRVVHVLIFSPRGELLLQRIAPGLRHEGMWGSSVAGYVQAGESYEQAAVRKLDNELGIVPALSSLGKSSMLDGSSVKFIGLYHAIHDGPIYPDSSQISEVTHVPMQVLLHERQMGLRAFTPTFLHVMDNFLTASGKP
jgi:isopentenyl-diphosphate delta-isomerase